MTFFIYTVLGSVLYMHYHFFTWRRLPLHTWLKNASEAQLQAVVIIIALYACLLPIMVIVYTSIVHLLLDLLHGDGVALVLLHNSVKFLCKGHFHLWEWWNLFKSVNADFRVVVVRGTLRCAVTIQPICGSIPMATALKLMA